MSYECQLNILHIIILTHIISYVYFVKYISKFSNGCNLDFDKLPKTCLILRSCTFFSCARNSYSHPDLRLIHHALSLSPVSMKKHRFVVKKDTGPSRYIQTEVFVNAPADVARADVAQAVHETYSAAFFQPNLYFDHRTVRVLKYIPESREYEFIGNTKSLKY